MVPLAFKELTPYYALKIILHNRSSCIEEKDLNFETVCKDHCSIFDLVVLFLSTDSVPHLPGTEEFHAYSDKEVDRFKRHLNGIVDDLHSTLESQTPSADHSTAEDEKQSKQSGR